MFTGGRGGGGGRTLGGEPGPGGPKPAQPGNAGFAGGIGGGAAFAPQPQPTPTAAMPQPSPPGVRTGAWSPPARNYDPYIRDFGNQASYEALLQYNNGQPFTSRQQEHDAAWRQAEDVRRRTEASPHYMFLPPSLQLPPEPRSAPDPTRVGLSPARPRPSTQEDQIRRLRSDLRANEEQQRQQSRQALGRLTQPGQLPQRDARYQAYLDMQANRPSPFHGRR